MAGEGWKRGGRGVMLRVSTEWAIYEGGCAGTGKGGKGKRGREEA